MTGNTYKEPEVVEEEPVVPRPKKKKKKKENPVLKGVQSVLDGTILTRDKVVNSLPFLFYMMLLAIMYIANSYYAEKKIIEIEKIKKEIKELRSENITTKSKLMFYSRQSEVVKRIGPYGIKESLIPPRKIFVSKDTTKTASKK
jgi:signal peptidase I